MVTLHFFVGAFFCLAPNTIKQQSSSPISGPCNLDVHLSVKMTKFFFRFRTNLIPNVYCMTSVEGPVLDYHVFNVSYQIVIRGSGNVRSTRHFKNVFTGCYWAFTTISNSSCTYLALLWTSSTQNHIVSSFSRDS